MSLAQQHPLCCDQGTVCRAMPTAFCVSTLRSKRCWPSEGHWKEIGNGMGATWEMKLCPNYQPFCLLLFFVFCFKFCSSWVVGAFKHPFVCVIICLFGFRCLVCGLFDCLLVASFWVPFLRRVFVQLRWIVRTDYIEADGAQTPRRAVFKCCCEGLRMLHQTFEDGNIYGIPANATQAPSQFAC